MIISSNLTRLCFFLPREEYGLGVALHVIIREKHIRFLNVGPILDDHRAYPQIGDNRYVDGIAAGNRVNDAAMRGLLAKDREGLGIRPVGGHCPYASVGVADHAGGRDRQVFRPATFVVGDLND